MQAPEFTDHQKLFNGYSGFNVAVFGERGETCRAA